MRARLIVLVMFSFVLLVSLTAGQSGDGVIEPLDESMVNPDANISFPPPVYVVRGSVDIRGTVTLPNIVNYLIEFRPLMLDDAQDESDASSLWFPAIVLQFEPVTDDILGTWNTLTARDGLYELRLTVDTEDGQEQARVSPIRVENNPPDFVETVIVEVAEASADEQADEPEEPETVATAEPVEEADDTPRVVALVNSNVRAGDSTGYGIVGFLLEGESAEIQGVSSRGTRWFFIRMENGIGGFIHPNIVRTEGNVSSLRLINPPPLPPTVIPIPTVIPAQPVPASSGANLVFGPVVVSPHPATCGQTYRITATIRNVGNANAPSGVVVEVRDSRAADGSVLEATHIAFPPVNAGAEATAFGHITMNLHYDELHHINLYLDVNNQVAEANENDNHSATAPYVLQRGGC